MAKVKKEKNEKKSKEDLGEKMDQMIQGLNTVAGALNKLFENQPDPKIVVQDKTENSSSSKFDPKLDDETYPSNYVPKNFRDVVDTILSPEFGITIVDFDDRTDFQVNIVIPEKYSSVPPSDREKGIQDVRSRMIPRSLGINGVKEWCTLIRKNLNKYYQQEGVTSPFNKMLE